MIKILIFDQKNTGEQIEHQLNELVAETAKTLLDLKVCEHHFADLNGSARLIYTLIFAD